MPGPMPKDPDRRSRSGKSYKDFRVVEIPVSESGLHRELPEDQLRPGEGWHPATLRWWSRWVESPLAESLPEVDWSELEVTALLHHQFMVKRTFTLAGELRQRMQKFGATPEDRMRLRILTVQADRQESEGARPAAPKSRTRGLRAVD